MPFWQRCKNRAKWIARWWWESMLSADGRRAWAFLALLGASGVFTAFAAVALFLLRGSAFYVFWLGIAAHVQLFVCLTGFMAMFVKRDLTVDTKYGKVVIKDQNDVHRIVDAEEPTDVQPTDK
jgi:hypothetical protein